jgi:hypothetical protein
MEAVMKSIALLVVVPLIVVLPLLAQPPDTLWTKTFGGNRNESSSNVQQTTDGGYIIFGTTCSYGAGGDDFWLIKTDANGDSLWTRTIGGSTEEECFSGDQTTDGGYIIVGFNNYYGDESYILLVKTNSQGDTSWTRSYMRTGQDFGRWVQQTNDGGYIIAGQTVTGHYNLWLIKTDAMGDTQWTRIYGGDNNCIGWCVQQTSDSGYIITGSKDYRPAIWLVRTDSQGDSLWTRTFECELYWTSGSGVQQTTDGGFIIVGFANSIGGNDRDIWLIKTDSNGDSLWSRRFGGTNDEGGSSVQQTSDGGYILLGTSFSYAHDRSDIWLIKTDSNGDSLWACILNRETYNFGSHLQLTNDGGYIVVGSTSRTEVDNQDVWLIRLNNETLVPEDSNIHVPFQFVLQPPYPNPFNLVTRLSFALPHASPVHLRIFNSLGQVVTSWDENILPAGRYERTWDASQFSSGIYFAELVAGNFRQCQKLLLIK